MIEQEFPSIFGRSAAQLSGRIQDCLGRLSAGTGLDAQSDNENAVGNLVLHLCGNVRQWIGSGVAGMPDHRERDAEFDARGGKAAEELADILKTTVTQAAIVIRAVPATRLTERITPQGYDVTVLEAIAHVVEHFSQHTGQIILLTKILTGKDLAYYQHLRGAGRAAGQRSP